MVGTKKDCTRLADEKSVEELIGEVQLPYMKCSAKDDVGVDKVFDRLARMALPGKRHFFCGWDLPR